MIVGRILAVLAIAAIGVAACTDDDSATGPGFGPNDTSVDTATYEYTIPLGAGDALDAGTPLEILPAELVATVGESIRIVNEDDRGHNVGPWFVGANETVRQPFTSPGSFEGVCTVHPSGQLILVVEAA